MAIKIPFSLGSSAQAVRQILVLTKVLSVQ